MLPLAVSCVRHRLEPADSQAETLMRSSECVKDEVVCQGSLDSTQLFLSEDTRRTSTILAATPLRVTPVLQHASYAWLALLKQCDREGSF
jgi:hypothetical protein